MKIHKHLPSTVIGAAIGIFVFRIFLWPKITERIVTVEKRTSDTVYVELRDTIYIEKVKHTFLRDTVFKEVYVPRIKSFEASENFLYGTVTVDGEVLGDILKMSIRQDFKLPIVTNVIDRSTTTTKTIERKGLYAGASINSLAQPSLDAYYVKKEWVLGYGYQFDTRLHRIGVARRIF